MQGVGSRPGGSAPLRVRVDSLGCRVNRYDAAAIRGDLVAAGHEVVDGGTGYDVYVLNSCTVTQTAESEAHRLLSRARRDAPDALRVLTGCYAETAASARGLPMHRPILPTLDKVPVAPPNTNGGLERPLIDLVVPNADKPALVDRILAVTGHESAAGTSRAHAFPKSADTRFFLKVQEGCDVRCAFCIIPETRGPARSVDPERVLGLAKQAVRRGYREIVVVGIHLGAYGRDLAGRPSLVELLRRILDETSIERLRLGSLEPWGVRPELIDMLRVERRFLPMLHLPLQSGSERVLRLMSRPMTARRYLHLVDSLFSARPDLALYLDVLVGFPGEGEQEFDETVRLLESFPWTKLHVFPYSRRPGTPAAQLPQTVPAAVVQARVRKLIDWSDARFVDRMASRVGATCEVLMEAGGIGHTRDHFPCRIQGAHRNEIVPTTLIALDDGVLRGTVEFRVS